MRFFLFLLLSACLVTTGCRKRKTVAEPAPAPEPPAVAQAETVQPTTSAAATPAPPVTADQLEAGPEFADLNNLVSWFYDRNKRVPTMPELAKMYAGPMPAPPGYKLVIDPKTKTVKAVR